MTDTLHPTPLRFDLEVARGGYAWWYLDAISDDGAFALTVIVFIGSVFSPHYARARRRGPASAHEHCAVNVALYRLDGAGPKLWTMAEHREERREASGLCVGRTRIGWTKTAGGEPELLVELDERETLFFGRRGPALRGRVRLRPRARFGPRIELDRWREQPRHRWYPVAPHARIEVELDQPALRFSGSGYHDVNEGDEALEQGFASWNWSRCELDDHRCAILYDCVDARGRSHELGLCFDSEHGRHDTLAEDRLGSAHELPRTAWGIARSIRADPRHRPRLISTLEDTPFYSRNLIATRLLGVETRAMHESLALDRFASRWVQFLLRFKTARG